LRRRLSLRGGLLCDDEGRRQNREGEREEKKADH
jgi:hypothetical protein